jgi:hypothetical protein
VAVRSRQCPVCGKRCAFWTRLRKQKWGRGELVRYAQRFHRPRKDGQPWPEIAEDPKRPFDAEVTLRVAITKFQKEALL